MLKLDEISKSYLKKLRDRNPRCAITISHEFLGGYGNHSFGFIPNDWDGVSELVFVPKPEWWGWKYNKI